MTSSRFTVYQDTEQWVPVLNWFWLASGESGTGHGPYPARWIAWLAGWLGTR